MHTQFQGNLLMDSYHEAATEFLQHILSIFSFVQYVQLNQTKGPRSKIHPKGPGQHCELVEDMFVIS